MPEPAQGVGLDDLLKIRGELWDMWDCYRDGDPDGAVVEFREAAQRVIAGIQPDMTMRGGRPVLTLPVNTLYAFMLMEVALVIIGGAHILRCAHCTAIFVVGSGTGRRSSSRYCSNRCRVAAQRAGK